MEKSMSSGMYLVSADIVGECGGCIHNGLSIKSNVACGGKAKQEKIYKKK